MDETTPGTMLADRAVLRVSGEDPAGFLQGLVTNDTAVLPAWAGLLTPQGKALFDFILWRDGDDILIDCEADATDALARRLSMYRLRRAITIARDDTLTVHWSRAKPDDEGAVPDPRLAELGWRWLAPSSHAAQGWREHRLALGVVEGVAELGAGETLWLECNARELNGVSFAKGCYVGQENTARMHHRDKVSRRLVVVPNDETESRRRVSYSDLGLMVALRRVEALGDARCPAWLHEALTAGETALSS